MSFGISARILAYQSTFGVSARILAYQSMFLYHFPLLTGWELQYRIQGCFHPVHVHFPVFLEQSLPFTSSTTRPVNLGVVCLPARATGVVTRFLLHGDAASVMFFFVCDLGSRAGAVGHGRVSSFPPALPASVNVNLM